MAVPVVVKIAAKLAADKKAENYRWDYYRRFDSSFPLYLLYGIPVWFFRYGKRPGDRSGIKTHRRSDCG